MDKNVLKKTAYELNQRLESNSKAFISYVKKAYLNGKIKDVQEICWLYQYFVSSEKERVFEDLMKGIKVKKEDVPFATQLFTPDWIVKFLVDNSLGKIVKEKKLEEIKFLDPCQGTGLILLYAFDVFLDEYLKQGYSKEDAVRNILTKNLYGKDIDETVCEITKLVLLLKAECSDKNVEKNMHIECINSEFGSLIKTNEKFDVVCTNPPYMGKKNINKNLSEFLKKEYSDTKSELYAAFIERCLEFTRSKGYLAMITIHSWMFISSFAKLRKRILDSGTIVKMLHTGAATFDDLSSFNALATSFIYKKEKLNIESEFIRLADYYKVQDKIDNFNNKANYYYIKQDRFFEIPNQPFIYWISEDLRNCFKDNKCLDEFYRARQGLATGKNKEFVKFWYEVPFEQIGQNYKTTEEFLNSGKLYAPYNKGGIYRKWYGNSEYVIKFDKENFEKLSNQGNHLPSRKYYFEKGITWSLFGFENFGVRYKDYGYVFDVSGSSMFPEEKDLYYVIGYLCSNVAFKFLSCLAPTVNFQVGNIASLPFKIIEDKTLRCKIDKLVKENIEICKEEWGFYETNLEFAFWGHLPKCSFENMCLDENTHSNDFLNVKNLEEKINNFEKYYNDLRNRLRKNEEELNRIYSEIFEVEDDVDYHVNDRDLTIKPFVKKDWIKSYLSYLVGVYAGRYDLETGIPNYSKYSYKINLEKIVEFAISNLGQENVEFIENILNCSIEKFYKKEFIKYHEKIYQNRPIYYI